LGIRCLGFLLYNCGCWLKTIIKRDLHIPPVSVLIFIISSLEINTGTLIENPVSKITFLLGEVAESPLTLGGDSITLKFTFWGNSILTGIPSNKRTSTSSPSFRNFF